MKKLLGGIFQKQKDTQPQPLGAALSPQQGASANSTPNGARRTVSPPTHDNVYKNGPRSSWDSFFASPVHQKGLSSTSPAVSPSVPVPAKVFNQNLEMLMREIVARIKLLITKMIQDVEFQSEFMQLCGLVNLAADKLLENGDPSLLLLKNYFSSPTGSALCEQTAFPSMVLDFVDKVRIYLLKNELKHLESSGVETSSELSTSASELERPIHFLMSCVQAIASNVALMEQFRCELPNVVYLTVEEYPETATYLRDMASQVLAAISDKNFNSGLVWYLNDCHTVAKSVRLMGKYCASEIASPATAAVALHALASMTKSPIADPRVLAKDPIAAAVGDALGLSAISVDTEMETRPSSMVSMTNLDDSIEAYSSATTQNFTVTVYNPLPGLKSLVYVLQKTCRFSLVLLGEFQSSGGYDLFCDAIKNASEDHTPMLIYLFTLILPLGTGFSGVHGEDENMATVITAGARNIGAFMSMRDLVLHVMAELRSTTVTTKAHSEQLLLQLLTTILQVYTSSYENFLCLEQKTQALAMIMSKLPTIDYYDAQVIILRIVEYVCIAAKADSLLPIEILAVLCSQFIEASTAEVLATIDELDERDERERVDSSDVKSNNKDALQDSPSALLSDCISRILSNSNLQAYREELNSFGLLERGVYALIVKVASCLSGDTGRLMQERYLQAFATKLTVWNSIALLMLKGNRRLVVEFREMQIHHSMYIIADARIHANAEILPKAAPSVFSLIVSLVTMADEYSCEDDSKHQAQQAVLQAGVESDLARMLQLLQAVKREQSKQLFMIEIIRQMFQGQKLFWNTWLSCQGHEILVSMLSSFHQTDDFVIFDAILDTISVSLDPQAVHNKICAAHFSRGIGYETLASCLITSGVLDTEHQPTVLNRVFELITGPACPRNKIRNPDAVQVLFCLLPYVQTDQGEPSLKRLLAKLSSNDDVGFTKKKQISSLVKAGIIGWFAANPIIRILADRSSRLQPSLMSLIIELSREELSTRHLRAFIQVIAKCMPMLLGNRYRQANSPNYPFDKSEGGVSEVGLEMLKLAVKGSTVPQVMVGTNVKTRMTSGYVHVVRQNDRIWPPSSGYTFSCWLRFPPRAKARRVSNNIIPHQSNNTVCVALCEGPLVLQLEGDDSETTESYCVLVGAELSVFSSVNDARSSNPSAASRALHVTAVTALGPTHFMISSHDQRYEATCSSVESAENWMRALGQSEEISIRSAAKAKATADAASCDDVVFVGSEENQVATVNDEQGLEGYACVMSAYSLETPSCFSRIYFDQVNGCLRIDTGSTTSGPHVNPALKRTSAIFKNVNIGLLRAEREGDAADDGEQLMEKPSDWHQIAISHRKSTLGSSQVTLYIDGAEVATKKLSYPSAPAAGGLQAFLGKDIQVCGTFPAVPWYMGPTWLMEDALPNTAIACMFLLGPSFSGQFSGHSYRSIGNWPEAVATNQLDRTTRRRVEASRLARRVQLALLAKATRRQWYEPASSISTTDFSQHVGNTLTELLLKKDTDNDAGNTSNRISDSKKRQLKLKDFISFVEKDCAMSAIGSEILEVLSSFKLSENEVLFSINTKLGKQICSTLSPNSASDTQIHFVGTECSTPLNFTKLVPALGGVKQLILPLLENSWRSIELVASLKLLVKCIRRNPSTLAEFLEMDGHALVASIIRSRSHLIDDAVLKAVVRLSICGALRRTDTKVNEGAQSNSSHPLVVDSAALVHLVLSRHVRQVLSSSHQIQLIMYIRELIDTDNPNAIFNARQMRRSGFVSWLLVSVVDVCSSDNNVNEVECLNVRHCEPSFIHGFDGDILRHLLDLLDSFLRLENHVDDVNNIVEFLLLSFTGQPPFSKPANPFRVVILQFLLHEIERNASDTSSTAMEHRAPRATLTTVGETDSFVSTLIDAVLCRGTAADISKKKKDRADGALASLASPSSSANNTTGGVETLDTALIEFIRRTASSPFARLEALLSARILFSLCQCSLPFSQHLLHHRTNLHKLKQALQLYSSDSDFFTPLLAVVSNIPIQDTMYHDPVLAIDKPQQYALPSPRAFPATSESRCIDQVWVLLGVMLDHICQADSELPNKVAVVVFTQLSFQVEVNEAFFATVCQSSFTVIRMITRCLLSCSPPADSGTSSSHEMLHEALSSLLNGQPPQSLYGVRAVACLDFLRVFITRCLFERNDFASHIIFLLEYIDDEVSRHDFISIREGQKCWLALLVHVVKHTNAFSDDCTFIVLNNLSTMCFALARYLVDETKHQGAVNGTEATEDCDCSASSPEATPPKPTLDCFGTDVLVFFLSSVRMCGESHIARIVGTEDHQFFYGCLIYCAQVALLSELNGFHRGTSPAQRVVDCICNSRQFFIQQNKVSGVIVCGTGGHHSLGESEGTSLQNAPPTKGGINAHLNKVKSLTSVAFHKVFGIGAESDRSFMLSLAAELLRWLVDDSESVRHAAIIVWQFLMQQRSVVIKELLIVEPKVSLLQNISSSKKEVIDVYHGGFERLLHIIPPQAVSKDQHPSPTRLSIGDMSASRDSWLQFHIWLTENFELLKDLIITRTEPILHHMVEVLLSCETVRKVNLNASVSRSAGQNELSLNLDFQWLDSDPRHSVDTTKMEENTADGAAFRIGMRKALMKFTTAHESTFEEMEDAYALWQETAARLSHTRSIWQAGGWGANCNRKPQSPSEADQRTRSGTSSSAEPFYLERSIFQQNLFRHRLDFTEGPQRLRVRLVRQYDSESSPVVMLEGTKQPPVEAPGDDDARDADPLEHKREFHQSVEAFREFMYKRTLSSAKRETDILRELSARCMTPRVKTLLLGVADREGHGDVAAALATRIYSEFLESELGRQLNATPTVVGEISATIAATRNECEPTQLPSTLFDLAEVESMQATLSTAGIVVPVRSEAKGNDNGNSDDETEEDAGVAIRATMMLSDDSDDSASDDDAKHVNAKKENSQETGSSRSASRAGLRSGAANDNRAASPATTDNSHPDFDPEDKVFDSSADYTYVGVARFMNRDDYPPQQSYNAAYVAGMSKTLGVFLVCRNAVYFVGGYAKVYSGGEGAPPETGSLLSVSTTPLPGNPTSPTRTGNPKKRTKDLIRDTFADIGLTLPGSKSSDSPLYTVIPINDDTASPNPSVMTERWCIKYSNIKQFYRIKYQLRPVGIEFFDVFGSTYFVQFASMGDREEIVKTLFQMPLVNSVFWNPMLRSSALSQSVKRIRQLLTKRWLKGSISNFEYLMHLNTLAGRSFNDITQYPVFPWVIADYSSTFLDLDNAATFRDLSKPMGALGENRAALFRERYAAMNIDAAHSPMDSPAFHYGTHYSCSAYVINFLIRMEPFSQLARDLQGGSFDHADRLFRSIPSSWDSASAENLQDVRELVPEFFFLPEFLYNANNYDLGTTQSGEVVSHVKLPPWAHADPREFIRLHRCALESKFVSENLHSWVDLVFGYKQTGVAALDAQNVFMHFTYEGAVDLDAIEDPVMRNAMLAQIENFGQTPSKLFTAPHPARKVPTLGGQVVSGPHASSPNPSSTGIGHPYDGNTMGSIEAFIKWHTPLAPALISIGKDYVFLKKQMTGNTLEAAVGDVKVVGDKFQCRGVGCTFMPPRFTKYLEWGAVSDGTMKLRVHTSSARHREVNKSVGIIEGAHNSRVNCAAFSDDGVVLVTGGDDAVVNVLECSKVHGRRLFKQIEKLVGHDDAVTSVAIDRAFNLVASASNDGSVILWDLRTRTVLRELGGHATPILQVSINSANGNVVVATASELRLWSINGDLLAATTVQAVGLGPMTSALSTNCESWQNGVAAVTGHANGTVTLWGLLYPSDIAKAKQDQSDGTDAPTNQRSGLSSGVLRTAVRVGVSRTPTQSAPVVLKAIPTCLFTIKKLLMDHRSAVTALTLGSDQRQFISGDSDGMCIRWVDDSVSTNAL